MIRDRPEGRFARVIMPHTRIYRVGVWTRTMERGRYRGKCEVYIWQADGSWKRYLLPPDDVVEKEE